MKIIFFDGSELYCESLYFTEKEVIVDDIDMIPIIEIQRIESV